MENTREIFELSKTAVSTFAGATLAFIMARLHDAERRQRENIASGNLALFVLISQYEEFIKFRRAAYEELSGIDRAPGTPTWLMLRPSMQVYGKHELDFASLTFLFTSRHVEIFNDLQRCQLNYVDLVGVEDFRRVHGAKMYERMAELDVTKPGLSLQQLENELGPQVVATASQLAVGVAIRAKDGEAVYKSAFVALRLALIAELDVWWRRPFPHLLTPIMFMKLEDVPAFQQSALPPFCDAILKAMVES